MCSECSGEERSNSEVGRDNASLRFTTFKEAAKDLSVLGGCGAAQRGVDWSRVVKDEVWSSVCFLITVTVLELKHVVCSLKGSAESVSYRYHIWYRP